MVRSSIFYEMHMHTPLCRHATGEPEEYAEVAFSRNLKGMVVTCHNPLPGGWGAASRMRLEEFSIYQEMVLRTRKTWEGRVDVRLGLECDYAPELEPWLRKQLDGVSFHHVLGSVHPQIPDYMDAYFRGDWFAYQKTYFDHLARSAECGLFDTLAHPDLIKNLSPEEWRLDRIAPFILEALDRIAPTGVGMELNTSGLNKAIREMNPCPWMLREMRARSIPVTIGADAHHPGRVGSHFEEALSMLEQAGYERVGIVLDRQRIEFPLEKVRRSLQPISASTVS